MKVELRWFVRSGDAKIAPFLQYLQSPDGGGSQQTYELTGRWNTLLTFVIFCLHSG